MTGDLFSGGTQADDSDRWPKTRLTKWRFSKAHRPLFRGIQWVDEGRAQFVRQRDKSGFGEGTRDVLDVAVVISSVGRSVTTGLFVVCVWKVLESVVSKG